MSKAKQRIDSAFHLGKRDALQGRHFRWARHPHYASYKQGYRAGGGIAPGDKPKRSHRRIRRLLRLTYIALYNWYQKKRGSCVRIGPIPPKRDTPHRARR